MALNKAAVFGIGAAVIAGVLLLATGKANAAPVAPVEPKNDDIVPPVPPPVGPAVVPIPALAGFIANEIQVNAYQAFAPVGETNPATQAQRDLVSAMMEFQTRVGLVADSQLGSRSAGALVYFSPGLQAKLLMMGVLPGIAARVAEGRALAEAAAKREGVI